MDETYNEPMHKLFLSSLLLAAASLTLVDAQSPVPTASAEDRAQARAIYKELIEINTTDTSLGNVTTATEAMRKRFLDAGFAPDDVQLVGPNERKMNLVVRYRAEGKPEKKAALFLCHIDVVEALPTDWHTNPFEFIEKDGYFYGRGTLDMKDSDAVLVASFIRLRREGFKPKRDLILALTADEEGGKSNGAEWLLKNKRELVDAAFVINPDSGGVELINGKPFAAGVEATEKIYADFRITAHNKGGHSSLPRPDNAIYELTTALNKLAAYQFPFELNPVTRTFFANLEKVSPHPLDRGIHYILKDPPNKRAIKAMSEDPTLNSTIHTTCVATRLSGGHANNALPQTAEANVNCRILPGHAIEEVRQQLIALFNDPGLTIEFVADNGISSAIGPDRKAIVPPTPLPEVMEPLIRITQAIWPGIPVTPMMEEGASDSVYYAQAGIPCYGYSAMAIEHDDVRAHGQDERVPVESFWKSLDFFYAFAKELGGE